MTKEQFLEIFKDYQEQKERVERIKDVIDYDNPLIDFGWYMMDMCLTTNFNEEQMDWIDWWLYERNSKYYSKSQNDDLDTPEKLWDFIQKYE